MSSNNHPLLILAATRDLVAVRLLESIANCNGWRVEAVENGWGVLGRVQYGAVPDLLVLDPGEDQKSLSILRRLHQFRPNLPVILLAAVNDLEQKSEALRLGVLEFTQKPLEPKSLESTMRRLLQRTTSRDPHFANEEVEWIAPDVFFVASNAVMRKVRSQLAILAQVDVPVLITGESGSGEEAAARLIHKLSTRSAGKFMTVSCSTLTSDQLEAELFGCEASVLAGSGRSQVGKLELCDKGTIFLDGVVDMSPELQTKLLGVLREKRISRLGTDQSIPVDVRVLASGEGDIHQAVAQKRLCEDLYYRLGAFTVQLPALRQRTDELLLLLDCFMRQLAAQYSLPSRTFSLRLLTACQNYGWPGNLRELENFVRRYLVMGDDELALRDLTQALPRGSEDDADQSPAALSSFAQDLPQPSSLKSLVDSVKGETERNAIGAALEQTHWNRKAAAKLLRVSYRSLLYKIEQYRMSPPPSLTPIGAEHVGKERSSPIAILPGSRSH